MNPLFLIHLYLAIGCLLGLLVFAIGLRAKSTEQGFAMRFVKWLLAGTGTAVAWPVVLWWIIEGELNRRRKQGQEKHRR